MSEQVTMPPNRMRLIAQQVAEAHGLTVDDLVGPKLPKRYVHPRHEAMWRIRHLGVFSLTQVGRFFGGRDHTTVRHGVQAHERRAPHVSLAHKQ